MSTLPTFFKQNFNNILSQNRKVETNTICHVSQAPHKPSTRILQESPEKSVITQGKFYFLSHPGPPSPRLKMDMSGVFQEKHIQIRYIRKKIYGFGNIPRTLLHHVVVLKLCKYTSIIQIQYLLSFLLPCQTELNEKGGKDDRYFKNSISLIRMISTVAY